MTPLVTLPHILLVLIGAFIIGARAYRSTLPAQHEGDADQRQLIRFASIASFGLFLLALAVILGLDLGLMHAARNMW